MPSSAPRSLSHPEEFEQWVRTAEGRADAATLSPAAELLAEHHVMSAVLDAMQSASERMSRGEPLDIELWKDVIAFIDDFVHRCHRTKEDADFFPAAVRHGWIEQRQADALQGEHGQARDLTTRLGQLAAEGDWEGVVRLSSLYLHVLRPHMRREEEALEQAEARGDDAAFRDLRRAFDTVEAEALADGGRARFLALARRICDRVGGAL